MNARASAIRGFLEPDTDTGWLAADIGRDSPWTLSVVGTAKERVAGERHARCWFRRFCATTDMDEAWGAFRLILSVVDRRSGLLKRWRRCLTTTLVTPSSKITAMKLGGACKENEEKDG